MQSIEAGALVLEPQTAAHAEEMFEILSDPAIYEHENEPPQSLHWLRSRFARLETRRSADGTQRWLNWVLRLAGNGLIGYVQATIDPRDSAGIAYVLASRYWGRGLARLAVEAMMRELVEQHRVRRFTAVLKSDNVRSLRLLERLGFTPGSAGQRAMHEIETGEILMLCGTDRYRRLDGLSSSVP